MPYCVVDRTRDKGIMHPTDDKVWTKVHRQVQSNLYQTDILGREKQFMTPPPRPSWVRKQETVRCWRSRAQAEISQRRAYPSPDLWIVWQECEQFAKASQIANPLHTMKFSFIGLSVKQGENAPANRKSKFLIFLLKKQSHYLIAWN